ncbi:ATP-binding protein [Luteibacter sp. NPDC031894]|uniref:ATP-binding protein n=1 Tax=Luteibacter sp. NPDC031894 TaxID=3390572 RepID=UPI003CFD0306
MNSQTSSEPERIEPIARVIDAECEKHGPYKAKQVAMGGGLPPITMNCPKCSEERREREELRAAEEARRRKQERIDQLFRRSAIPLRFLDRTLEGYKATNDGQRRALRIATRYVETFADSATVGPSMVLAGKPGTGKTHIACGIANALIHMGKPVLFMTVLQALRHIKETYRKDSTRTEEKAMAELMEPELLILDEVGAQLGSEHEKMLMFEIINERYQNCRSTILISNLTGDELTEFLGDRVMDRFRENGAIVAFDWNSHRGQRDAS